jgi:hypothetical protein
VHGSSPGGVPWPTGTGLRTSPRPPAGPSPTCRRGATQRRFTTVSPFMARVLGGGLPAPKDASNRTACRPHAHTASLRHAATQPPPMQGGRGEVGSGGTHHSSFMPSSFLRAYVRRYTNSPSPLNPNGAFRVLYLSRNLSFSTCLWLRCESAIHELRGRSWDAWQPPSNHDALPYPFVLELKSRRRIPPITKLSALMANTLMAPRRLSIPVRGTLLAIAVQVSTFRARMYRGTTPRVPIIFVVAPSPLAPN